MNKYTQILSQHSELSERVDKSTKKIHDIRDELDKSLDGSNEKISVCLCGSLGRKEIGEHSDMDIFLFSKENIEYLPTIKLLSQIIEVNKTLEYKELSNDGEFLKIYSSDEMAKKLGSPKDDNENLFTARMLMLLESQCVWNCELFKKIQSQILEIYFRNHAEQNNFKPLFLLNDILRFWRTICLNYEAHREDKNTTNESGGKKNLNLRFSRKLTVFSTILPMIAKPITSIEEMQKLIEMTPLKRFSTGLDYLSDDHLQKDFDRFLNDYEYYLNHKETDSKYKDIKERAKYFSNFIFKALSHKSIDEDYKKYLII
jgi:predicted nucleotidyltransferase